VLHTDDLVFARAIEVGQPDALARLEALLASSVATALRRLNASDAFVDEALQLARQKILMGLGGRRPQIAEYAGRGSIEAWLKALAISTGLNLLRQRHQDLPLDDDSLWEEPVACSDPELDYVKEHARAEFREAVKAALNTLPARERTVLRLHLVAGLNIEEIGNIYKVHRATVARWIASARETLVAEARRRLAERLRVSRPELDSLLRQVRSALDVSVGRLLAYSK
jgi:RNA polymerase sigma-70 factor (ECF subfamily)